MANTVEEARAAYELFRAEHARLGNVGPVIVPPALYQDMVRFGLVAPEHSPEPFFRSGPPPIGETDWSNR